MEKGRAKMIDPLQALDGLQKAISMVKKASAIATEIGSLAPMISKMFDAKSQASKAMVEAKRSGGSNMGIALQIEMALEQSREFEKQLQLLFFQANKVDVWQKIKARAAEMDRDDAIAARKAKEEEQRQKDLEAEQMQWAVAIVVLVMFIGAVGWGLTQISELCATTRCGR